ncbi:MAG: ABC transporter permease [Bacillota bacterium]
MSVIEQKEFTFVADVEKESETFRPSLTYWQDAWRRLKKNKLAMVGLAGIILIVLFGVIGPYFTPVSYSDQQNDYKNLPPRLGLYVLNDELSVYVSNDYNMFAVDNDGNLTYLTEIDRAAATLDRNFTGAVMSPAEKKRQQQEAQAQEDSHVKSYAVGDGEIVLDYSNKLIANAEDEYQIKITYGEYEATEITRTIMNRKFPFGTDVLGRDLLTRVMYGARISLLVALVATLVNFAIGVLYGAIAGFEGGRVDNIMMRIVDIINSIPLMLYIILLMVLIGNKGIWTIILAIGTVYWVNMARLVRGQTLALKEQEYVLAARALGVSRFNIIRKHLIPNAMGPIIISMTMMIPTAVFTESFLSFIGLGVSAPMASWGTLANNALPGLLTYPYQLMFPAMAIAITMLAFNFLGDGLRDALDPRLRKG